MYGIKHKTNKNKMLSYLSVCMKLIYSFPVFHSKVSPCLFFKDIDEEDLMFLNI